MVLKCTKQGQLFSLFAASSFLVPQSITLISFPSSTGMADKGSEHLFQTRRRRWDATSGGFALRTSFSEGKAQDVVITHVRPQASASRANWEQPDEEAAVWYARSGANNGAAAAASFAIRTLSDQMHAKGRRPGRCFAGAEMPSTHAWRGREPEIERSSETLSSTGMDPNESFVACKHEIVADSGAGVEWIGVVWADTVGRGREGEGRDAS
ncbi:hypothetical protein EJ04DRAFT_553484 [Polyplosphaeria fusca]|uniref:Uncharacterized protein n=1 Tax=Polyplosphaeria fusca TaxID=682080 RepID=A0A9P4V2E7_9PLEO|nr:hypothetical protein EJ04DRAFT_553484 [Polyplosphaeria fusca]